MTRELTGKHVLAITIGAFAVIIGVNLFMAFSAIRTFPGLEVANSYVASQSFDADRAAQERLGWVVTPDYDGKNLHLHILDERDVPAPVRTLEARIGRSTHQRDDIIADLVFDGLAYHAPMDLAPGHWIIHVTATALDGTKFKQRLDHFAGSKVGG